MLMLYFQSVLILSINSMLMEVIIDSLQYPIMKYLPKTFFYGLIS